MSARAFLDTNVLVYAFDGSDPHKRAIATDWLGTRHVAISAQVLGEFYVTVTQKLAQPLDPETAAAAVAELMHWPVVALDAELAGAAIATGRRWKISYWDALIVEAAVVAGAGRLITEDLQDGAEIRGVRIHNPFQTA